ncbi:tRNA uridine-5-carboxymethylaminomethyl(34) synthesis GTPase MnmE [Rhizobium sp. RU36D]|uniref:tRNA uridine-5-carboxymethylaminomethyl(34) synthesis GTPase MnmE n=1 Tax=Rhizobium sp. RU36D TaxID=1907415 RepID=UPI0009D8E2E5|nr:tRNA uridine-5-carboxymethylaminomethyl(34) synthesis GTPase MnmE [Rhizobium sp. RU36D]SMC89213.1 tRNA modification GTPase trmE [Rhizobium sp. RU36D]
MASFSDTIFALSSGPLPAGVAVVRISGSAAFAACEKLAGKLPDARIASLRSIRNRDGNLLDQALVLVFPGPNSFTGEDCVELHLHGSRAVLSAVYAELEASGCRTAEAGEFSRRAFQRGKLDLAEVEGLGDLLAAETEMQRRLAISGSSGTQSKLYASWRQRILHARAMLEAELDFADEEDVPGSLAQSVIRDVAALREEMQEHIRLEGAGEIIRDGFKAVIVGAPNAGKSSLMNALAGNDVAIVTDIAGTTRDVLHADLNLSGYLVRLYDTAGLREATDKVERMGIDRARVKISEADLILLLCDLQATDHTGPDLPDGIPIVSVGTKLDLNPDVYAGKYDLVISTETGAGIDELRNEIIRHIEARTHGLTQVVPSRLRHVNHIKNAIFALRTADDWSIRETEFLAEDLRQAADALGRISGRIDTEEVLGVIFSSFCIGK